MMFKSHPLSITIRFTLLASAAFTMVSCGDSGESGGGAGSCEPVVFSMLNVAKSEAKVCAAAIQCMATNCSDAVLECAGPDYRSGVYSGTCASYYACVKGCNCVRSCADACDPATLDCASCLSSKMAMGCTLKCISDIASCGK
jgi:hypothetical protein